MLDAQLTDVQPAAAPAVPLAQAVELTKSFGSLRALDGISFAVQRGEVLGLIGPNGAGKTTTLQALTGFVQPSAGQALVGGYDLALQPTEARRQLGYLAEDAPLYPELSVLEHLEFAAQICQLKRGERRRRIGEVCAACGLLDLLARPVGSLSRGFRQRLGLAQALVHDPSLLLLDEPTYGLDPAQAAEVRDLIIELGQEKAVIVSTHLLGDAQAMCSRLLVLSRGKVVADGSPAELASREQGTSYRLLLDPGAAKADQVIRALREIRGVRRVALVQQHGDALALSLSAKAQTDLRREISCCARDKDWLLLELQRQQPSMIELFRRLTQD